ncbi:DEAD/DEAH box helicase domain-containing protein [Haloactinopolyspora alba]|uniref:DEAD/DEAH box helicase domain-containing protein n=1 Tax=Haloactinopolyspora alba TaxID=648780 RepID=A0A2P8E7H5_9ACTN|nr:DEAD/DEAH box helicase [Haloactinopolyspora alba]PSL05422.1 DEAD/DEAH box helicase domain-containing protein [Haloactinopolyspora alba]
MPRPNRLHDVLVSGPHRSGRVTHVETIPARTSSPVDWPHWVDPVVRDRFVAAGVDTPWTHQAEAASLAWAGRSAVVATGTASGKSLAYLLPALTAARAGRRTGGTTLYISPTKALAADQLRALDELAVPDVVATTYDGDTPVELRDVARAHATYLLTNPDMLHHAILPRHHRWAGFLRSLRFVVIDECHGYRGVFGSHVAQVLRRLRRVCSIYGASPTFVLASATTADPARTAELLTGEPVEAVTEDGSPSGAKTFLLWEPPLNTSSSGEHRRGVLAETADLLTDLVVADARTVAFVRSRRAAESVAGMARSALAEVDPSLPAHVASYRSGYLAHERRELEAGLNDGSLRAVAATTALELGVDVSGLDAVLVAGWPGTRASLWQQCGRAGRAGGESLAVLLADDDPLDAYLVRHPDALFGRPVESTVLDPDNPYVLAPHLCAAAAERPLSPDDAAVFGPSTQDVLHTLEHQRLLRRRSKGQPSWHWTRRDRPTELADLRGSGGVVSLVEQGTGRVLGTVDAVRAHFTAHPGAVYVHQGETYLVDELDLDDGVAMARADTPEYTTTAREVSTLHVLEETTSRTWGQARLAFGTVEVSSQVVGYLKRALGTGEVLGEIPLELPERRLRTRSVWWTLPDEAVEAAGVDAASAPGAAHAAEHAAIGMLPLMANCDRWDVGGLSTVAHPDTGMLTVFVHDGHPGGAGFAERGFHAAQNWLSATREAVATCACRDGCPSCVQSPKCGNGNDPLDKAGAVRLLDTVLREAE